MNVTITQQDIILRGSMQGTHRTVIMTPAPIPYSKMHWHLHFLCASTSYVASKPTEASPTSEIAEGHGQCIKRPSAYIPDIQEGWGITSTHLGNPLLPCGIQAPNSTFNLAIHTESLDEDSPDT